MFDILEKICSANKHHISVPVRLRNRPWKVVTPPHLEKVTSGTKTDTS